VYSKNIPTLGVDPDVVSMVKVFLVLPVITPITGAPVPERLTVSPTDTIESRLNEKVTATAAGSVALTPLVEPIP